MKTIGRNDPCPCGSGKRYKHCCGSPGKVGTGSSRAAGLSIPDALRAALEHHQAGRLPQAEAIYQQILQIEPNHADTLHFLGVIAFQTGKNELAAELISKAIRITPLNSMYLVNLGTALKNQGKLDAAIECYHKALALTPDYAKAHYNLGVALQHQGKLAAAIESYRHALTINPEFAEAYYGLGIAFQRQLDFDAAVRSYTKARSSKSAFAEMNRASEKGPTGTATESTLDSPVRKERPERRPVVVVDAVFFQLMQTGISRVWTSVFDEWSKSGFSEQVLVLDRIGTAPKISGLRYRLVGAYDVFQTTLDRAMLQRVCDEEGADVFISTYNTSPVTTPSVCAIYDMIPECFPQLFDLKEPQWQEKHLAIRRASHFIAISEASKQDLLRFATEVSPETVTVALLGVSSVFRPRSTEAVAEFRRRFALDKPYFLIVGARCGYKNTRLTFEGLARLPNFGDFDVVCTSTLPLEPELAGILPDKILRFIRMDDDALSIAYSGAVALLHPSLSEGFGLPLLEAMASGCPVITCRNGAIPEVVGEAGLYVRQDSPEDVARAIREIQEPGLREKLVASGIARSRQFSWTATARKIGEILLQAATFGKKPMSRAMERELVIGSLAEAVEQFRIGHADEAEKLCRKVCDTYPQEAQSWNLLGLFRFGQGDLGNAMQFLEKAARLAPDSPNFQSNLGSVLLDAQRPTEARLCLDRALKLQPENAETHYKLGLALAALGDHAGARRAFGAALSRQPRFPLAIKALENESNRS